MDIKPFIISLNGDQTVYYIQSQMEINLIMSISRPFDMIMDLNDTKHLWKIAIRITELWYAQIPPKPRHLEMILMVQMGTKYKYLLERKSLMNEKNV
ncbi:hypothetical protein Lal_00003644 [Lupinus albus]|nr:hypothetical protein Lal_00003644 [Lupinus albus]